MPKGAMGVKVKFHKGSWWVFITHRGHRRAKKIGDKETAVLIARQVRERLAARDLNLERQPPVPVETLKTYATGWLKSVSATLKASTVRFYTANLHRHVLPLLGSRPVASLSRADCRELITATRARGLRVNTVRGITRTLSVVLSQLVEDERLPANPALRLGRYLRRGDEPKAVVQPLTREEAALLVTIARRTFRGGTRGSC